MSKRWSPRLYGGVGEPKALGPIGLGGRSTKSRGTPIVKHIALSVFGARLQVILSSATLMNLGQKGTIGMQGGVHHMADAIVQELHTDGPTARLKYFSPSGEFLMASSGRLVFPSYDSAITFVYKLATQIRRIDLTWNEIRVDSLAPSVAMMAASFHEILFRGSGAQDTSAGYFTAVAEYIPTGWKLRNAHWSIECPQH